ncbi:class I SAM-dependent RNA methyltransferase [Candidatus Saccharibacteria bacterium]|nr:class I SAM-dependent RNA methyltransferase [Candidatus Saccharibacteria bacterium]
MPKRTQILSAHIDRLVPGGQGIATLENGKKAFIWNALPDEDVSFRLTKSKSSYCEGVAETILHPSNNRITPKDDCFLSTSPWQIMHYDFELSAKQALVKDSFAQHHLYLPLPPIKTDRRDFYYRNKMEYSLYWDNDTNKIQLAFHARGSHRKIPIKTSSLERPEILTAAQAIIDDLNHAHASARDYQSLLVRSDQKGKTSSALFVKNQPHPTMPTLSDTLLDHAYQYSPNGFFQINLPVYELALQDIKKHVDPNLPLLDLYSGVGSIGLSVAYPDQALTLVEVNASAYRELEYNVQNFHGKSSPRQHTTPILEKSENITSHLASNQTVILDPPRAGCAISLLDAILDKTPKTLIYLSCNPATQARDLSLLCAAPNSPYTIQHSIIYNFFPRTPHIEHLVVLTKKQ